MALLKLLGVLIVIVGFAFKLDSILIVVVAAIVTAFSGGLGITGLLETLGTSFVANRSMAIFILIMLVTGTLERNGLKNAAASLIGRLKNATAGKVIAAYGLMRGVFALPCGYCGTLCTPMAANFNIVPVAMLDMKDRFGVIKNQVLPAVLLLAFMITYMILFK